MRNMFKQLSAGIIDVIQCEDLSASTAVNTTSTSCRNSIFTPPHTYINLNETGSYFHCTKLQMHSNNVSVDV